ncbi:YlzJ-like family protein [Paenibacillus sp. F411]|uniref:YlzJ-like family protein n=1 Tax=Paenibacillus sp. F411 TaxID=2820239 RepID=UPI001AAFD63F|nr:YlzJ-like family protein [Paenibacillus sp. F411]MBO2944129.1 YlzJ-like family protein [Paenibacillus sp. F411]
MTLYTVMPLEMVFSGGEPAAPDSPLVIEMRLNGVLLEAEIIDHQSARIVRLLDCQLSDYLNPAYMPGSQISFIPVLHA